MMLPKVKAYRNKKITDSAEGEPCVSCGRNDGTTVFAHYSGMGAARLGKGKAIKCHDYVGAYLCGKCHDYYDQHKGGRNEEQGFEFLMLCMITIRIMFEKVVIK